MLPLPFLYCSSLEVHMSAESFLGATLAGIHCQGPNDHLETGTATFASEDDPVGTPLVNPIVLNFGFKSIKGLHVFLNPGSQASVGETKLRALRAVINADFTVSIYLYETTAANDTTVVLADADSFGGVQVDYIIAGQK